MHPLSLFKPINIVIVFHRIPSKDWFRNALITIGNIYRFIPIEEIESYYYHEKKINNCAHISFDDGDKTVYENAFPVLKEMSVPASLFVSPKIIRDRNNYWFQNVSDFDDIIIKRIVCELKECNYEQIEKYSKMSILKSLKIEDILRVIETYRIRQNISGNYNHNLTEDNLMEIHYSNLVKIGAHSLNHPVLGNEIDKISEKEIIESVRMLSQMLNSEIRYFAYPNGGTLELDYGIRELKILKENSIKLAFSSKYDFFSKKNNPLAIPRYGLSKGKKLFILSKLLLGTTWGWFRSHLKREISEEQERKDIKEKLALLR